MVMEPHRDAVAESQTQAAIESLCSCQEEDSDTECKRECWVCFAKESDEPTAKWTHPCRCRGTTKWVHQACIQRWIDEKQKGNSMTKVCCPQCGTAYIIRFPSDNLVVAVVDYGDRLFQKSCPLILACVCIGSVYFISVSFGAITLMQCIGHDEAIMLMEKCDPLVMFVSLPLIPVGLVIGQMIRWENTVLNFLRRTVPHLPFSRQLFPIFTQPEPDRPAATSWPPVRVSISLARVFCNAFFFPTIATAIGSGLFKRVHSNLKRALYGAIVYVAVKGVIKIYYRQSVFVRQCKREIVDFFE